MKAKKTSTNARNKILKFPFLQKKKKKTLNIESFHHNFIFFIVTVAILFFFPCFLQLAKIGIHETELMQDSITSDRRVSTGNTGFAKLKANWGFLAELKVDFGGVKSMRLGNRFGIQVK